MIHGDINRSRLATTAGNRRAKERTACARELVLSWSHNFGQRVRFRVVDMSADGMRIAGTLPIVSDLTGVAITLLPEGENLHRLFVVKWASEKPVGGEYHAGLQFLG